MNGNHPEGNPLYNRRARKIFAYNFMEVIEIEMKALILQKDETNQRSTVPREAGSVCGTPCKHSTALAQVAQPQTA